MLSSARTATELAEEYFRAWLAADGPALTAVLAPHVTFDGIPVVFDARALLAGLAARQTPPEEEDRQA